MWSAAVRLALVVSTVAAAAAIVHGAAGDITEPAMVLVVMLFGFVASWVQSGRVGRSVGGHRVTLVAVRRRVG